jgi:hypothetical protein
MHLTTERHSIDDPQNVRELRECVNSAFVPAQRALRKIKALVDAQSKVVVETDLGEHGSELVGSYNALKLMVQTLDPTAEVPDLE